PRRHGSRRPGCPRHPRTHPHLRAAPPRAASRRNDRERLTHRSPGTAKAHSAFKIFCSDGVIPSGAVLQAKREPALSEVEGDLARIATNRHDQTATTRSPPL